MIVVLDNIRSIYNVGSIFRTADALGVEKIYLCGITPTPIDRFGLKNKALAKVALGAEQSVPWSKVGSTLAAVEKLKQEGYSIIALEQDERAISLFDADLKGPIALVIGGENKGVRPLVKKECDFLLSIPNKSRINSLNASVAGGIAMYEALRQRNGIPE